MNTQKNDGRTIIVIKNHNHDAIQLLKLFRNSKIRVERMMFQRGEGPATKESLPVKSSVTKVGAGYYQTKAILETSIEFQNSISQILGTV